MLYLLKASNCTLPTQRFKHSAVNLVCICAWCLVSVFLVFDNVPINKRRRCRSARSVKMLTEIPQFRFLVVAIPSTFIGLSIFPILKTFFPNENNLLLMSVAHLSAVSISFFLHSQFTFRSTPTPRKWAAFTILNTVNLFLVFYISEEFSMAFKADIRVIQPVTALIIQLGLVPIYSLLMPRKSTTQS